MRRCFVGVGAFARAAPLTLLVLVLVLVLAPGSAHAQDADPAPAPAGAPQEPTIRAVVRVDTDDDEAILARVRGHVSDLAVELVVEYGVLERNERKRRAAAARLARRQDARAVVWFTPLAQGGFRVHVADMERKQLLERDVAPDPGRPEDRSALLETAALVVRSAIFAMQEGTAIGPPAQLTEEEEPPPVLPPPRPRPPRLPTAVPIMALGAGWAADGVDGGHPGLLARATLRRGRFGVELGLHLPLPATIEGEFARVSLWRVPIWLGFDVTLAQPTPGFRLGLAIRGSVILYSRTTEAVFGGAVSTPPSTVASGGIGPELRLEFRIVRRLSLEVAAGVDLVARAPELNYQQGAELIEFESLWLAQPHVGLSLLFR